MLNTSLILAAAEGHHVVNELPMDPIWYCLLYTSDAADE